MSMNSFSFKSGNSKRRTFEDTKYDSTLLDLNPNGKLLPGHGKVIKEDLSAGRPIDLQKLHKDFGNSRGRRNADRHEVQLTVLVANHCKHIRTQSLNISLTGLLLEDYLPSEFSKQWIEIVLIQTDESGKKSFLLLRGKTVTSDSSRRIQFDENFKDPKANLQKFLEPLFSCVG